MDMLYTACALARSDKILVAVLMLIFQTYPTLLYNLLLGR
jgi:hypothetical protein